MTWEELETTDPFELFFMGENFVSQFQPVKVDETLTIGMAAYGNIQTTLFALRAILASVCGNFELILVDDASPDETCKLFELVSKVHHNTIVFSFKNNIEYSGSLNTILSNAHGERILFVSNDIFVTPAYIAQLLRVAENRPNAGIIRGCSNFVDNGLIPHNIKDCGELDNFYALFSYAEARASRYNLVCIEDIFLTGDAFLISRDVLDRIGFIDTRFFGYFADHDLGIRARRSGFNLMVAMGAFAWHQHGSNIDYLSAKEKDKKLKVRWARVNENWARFKEKYGLPISLPYQGMRNIPWDELALSSSTQLPTGPACNHQEFVVPTDPAVVEWRYHRVNELAKRAKVYTNASRVTDAIRLCRQALRINPLSIDALTVLGSALVYQGKLSEGMKIFRRAVSLGSASIKAHSNLLLTMNYSDTCSQKTIYRQSQRWQSLHTQESPVHTSIPAIVQQRSRIRIVYLSPDFRSHSVSYFFSPLLKHHNREKYEIFCLSDVLYPDSVTDRLMRLCDGWRDIARLDIDSVEQIIRGIQPDILVDLAGHTGHSIRLAVFSKRLAPVQVSWLGYPNTTGITGVDFRLTDDWTDPSEAPDTKYYSEQLYRLPSGFICYEPPEKAPDVDPLPLLKNGYITFGSFNMLPKITDTVIAVWSEILRQLPDAKLVLKNHYLRDAGAVRYLMNKFGKQGISEERIILLPADIDIEAHLKQYGNIDVALDTFPYNGTTTTCEALFMGVPVVTLSGERHSGRVGKGILSRVGLQDLIASDCNEYVEIALRLVASGSSLSRMRNNLRNAVATSQLCDASLFARSIEAAFIHMLSNFRENFSVEKCCLPIGS